MKNYIFSASATKLVDMCPGAATLEQFREHSTKAERGTTLHTLFDAKNKGADVSRLLKHASDDVRGVWNNWDVDALWRELDAEGPTDVRATEFAWAMTLRDGKLHAVALNTVDRDYRHDFDPASTIVGTTDFVIYRGDGSWMVGDVKTGLTALVDSVYTPDPAQINHQLKLNAAAVCEIYDLDHIQGAIVRLDEVGEQFIDELAAWKREDLQKFALKYFNLSDEFQVGEHCKLCIALPHCKANKAALTVLQTENTQLEIISDDDAARAYGAIKAYDAMRDKAWDALKRYMAQRGEVDLENGSVLKEIESSREYVISNVALNKLGELYGPEVVRAAGKVTTTKKDIIAAVPKSERNNALEELRKAGAFRVGKSSSLRVVKGE